MLMDSRLNFTLAFLKQLEGAQFFKCHKEIRDDLKIAGKINSIGESLIPSFLLPKYFYNSFILDEKIGKGLC